ncbi:MAG: hypothetical protein QF911_01150 [Candidatus Thalassarchaeaceae archaeon]|jgi:hypothetical protein|nr:hypothetical protein [Candidatus Thalassarchaeaceae archaeon]
MTVRNPRQDDDGGLEERLEGIPRARLIEEVVSRWDEVIRLESELASLRRRLREVEMAPAGGFSGPSFHEEAEERVRVANARVRQLEGQLQNEKARRVAADADAARLIALQDENSKLLRNEEELLLLVMDMEAEIERLRSSGEA